MASQINFKLNKKAVSEVISYVFLIAIAIGISVIVYAFLKVQIPDAEKTCEEGISLVIRDAQCNNTINVVSIEFQNKGLFRTDGVYIRFANDSNAAPASFLNATGQINTISSQRTATEGFFYFGKQDPPLPLSPNREYIQTFNYSSINLLRKIQIQPFINDDETQEAIICENKGVTLDVNCN